MKDLTLAFETYDIRTIVEKDCIWWALIDVCKILELTNSRMVASQLDEDEVRKFNLRGLEGDTWFVNESGLYHVIFTSRSEKAKPFRRWVTHEVLPSIREKGYYRIPKLKAIPKPKGVVPVEKVPHKAIKSASDKKMDDCAWLFLTSKDTLNADEYRLKLAEVCGTDHKLFEREWKLYQTRIAHKR